MKHISFGTLGLFAAGLLALLILLATPWAQSRILATVNARLPETLALRFEAEGTGGLWPWHIKARSLKVYQKGELLAEVSGLDLSWKPRKLLNGQIEITSLEATSLAFHTPPASNEPSSGRLPTPSDLPRLILRTFIIESVTVIDREGMTSPVFILSGLSSTEPGRASVDLQLLPHDANTSNDYLELTLDYDQLTDRFELDAETWLGEQGLLGWLGAPPALAPLSLSAQGDGAASAWSSSNKLVIGRLLDGDIQVNCDCQKGEDLTLTGAVTPGDINLEILPFSVEGPVQISTGLAYDDKRRRLKLTNTRLSASGAGFETDLKVTEDGDDLTFTGEARLIPKDGPLADQGLGALFLTFEEIRQSPADWSTRNAVLETLRGKLSLAEGRYSAEGLAASAAVELDAETLIGPGDLSDRLQTIKAKAEVSRDPTGKLTLTDLFAQAAGDSLTATGVATWTPNQRLEGDITLVSEEPFNFQKLALTSGTKTRLTLASDLAPGRPNVKLKLVSDALTYDTVALPPSELNIDLGGLSLFDMGRADPATLKGEISLAGLAPSKDIDETRLHLAFNGDLPSPCIINGSLHIRGIYSGNVDLCATPVGEKLKGKPTTNWDIGLETPSLYAGPLILKTARLALKERWGKDGLAMTADLQSDNLSVASVELNAVSLASAFRQTGSGWSLSLDEASLTHTDTRYQLAKPVVIEEDGLLKAPLEIMSDGEGTLAIDLSREDGNLAANLTAERFKLPVVPAFATGTGSLTAGTTRNQANFDLNLAADAPRQKASFTLKGNWDGESLAGRITLIPPPRRGAEPLEVANVVLPLGYTPAGGFEKRGSATLTLAYHGPLRDITAMLPIYDHTLDGQLDLDAHLAEQAGTATWSGEARLTQGSYAYESRGLHIEGFEITAAISGKDLDLQSDITIKQIEGAGANPTLEGAGKVSMTSLRDWSADMAVTLDQNSLVQHPNYKGTLSGRITGTATPEKALISGRIRIDQIDGSIPPPGPVTLTRLNIVPVDQNGLPLAPPARTRGTSLFPKIDLDVRIEAADHIFIRGRGLDSEWGSDLAVAGTTDQPSVTGQLVLKRGEIYFGGRPFEFTDGTIRATGEDLSDPVINLTARYRVDASLEARILVAGRVSAPEVHFDSTPSLPEDDIVAYILFGKPMLELGPAEALRTAMAIAQLSGRGGLGSSLIDRTRKAIGVDVLEISASESESTAASTVTVGKYLTSDIFVTLSEDFGTQTGSAAVTYKVTDSISIGAKVDEAAETEASIEWVRNY